MDLIGYQKKKVGWRLCLRGELEDGNGGLDMIMFYGIRQEKLMCQNKTAELMDNMLSDQFDD